MTKASERERRAALLVIIGSTRSARIGLPIAEWIVGVARDHDGFDVEVADLAAIDLPMFDEPRHPRLGQYEHEHTKRWSEIVRRADAIVFVIPEYNHGYNAAVKNAIDHLWSEWNHKPVGFVSYGGVSGGLRAVEQLKPVLNSVKMLPVAELPIPLMQFMVDGEFTPTDSLTLGALAVLAELVAWTGPERPRAGG